MAGISVTNVFHKIEAFGVTFLPISIDHIVSAASLPHIHSDPFDRLFVAQALAEGVGIVTIDDQIAKYPVATIWK